MSTTPNISIHDHQLPDETHSLYDITFFTHKIPTLLTHTPSIVTQWLSNITKPTNNNPIICGLDVEWRPNFSKNSDNPIATLQLCTNNTCLIFQILRSPSLPQSLAEFLKDERVMFVGVGIESDVEKLVGDYGLSVGKVVDLRDFAAEKMGESGLKSVGLKELGKRVLGMEVVKPKRVGMSRWDCEWLSYEQIQYACVDAFLSFEIGRVLNVAGL